MKLRKKYWYMIYAGGVILILLVFTFLFRPSGIGSLDPEDYKDNPELQDFVKGVQGGKLSPNDYDFWKLTNDSRFSGVCAVIIESEPSLFDFIRERFSWEHLKEPLKLHYKWKRFHSDKCWERGTYLTHLVRSNFKPYGLYPMLIKYLGSDKPELQINAIEALTYLGDKRAVEPLIATLNDKESYVRSCAAKALGKLGDKRAVEPLFALLKSNNEYVRLHAALALSEFKDKRAVQPLEELLKEGFNKDRMSAIKEALKKLKAEKSTGVSIL